MATRNATRDYAEIKRINETSSTRREAFHRLMNRCEQETGGSKIRFLKAAYSIPRDAAGRFIEVQLVEQGEDFAIFSGVIL